jgi:hypothetical protein
MASIPTTNLHRDSALSFVDGLVVDRATNGKARGRNFWSGKKAEFELRYSMLTSTQKQTLLDFYDANRGTTFDLTFDSVLYPTLIFAPNGAPRVVKRGTWYDVTLRVVEV